MGWRKSRRAQRARSVSSFPSVLSKSSSRHCSFQTLWFREEHRIVDKEKDKREEKKARWEAEGGGSDKEVREPAQLPASGLLVNPCVYPLVCTVSYLMMPAIKHTVLFPSNCSTKQSRAKHTAQQHGASSKGWLLKDYSCTKRSHELVILRCPSRGLQSRVSWTEQKKL